MQVVTKRELNQNTAAVLARVTEAEDAVVTERGRPRWLLSAVREHETALVRLEREGRYEPPAAEPAPWAASEGGQAYASEEVDALLAEMRGDH